MESPPLATDERCLIRVGGSEERVSAGLVEQPPRCDEVACRVPDTASFEVEDSNQFAVGGVEVIAVSETNELPDRATTIEVKTTPIYSSDGPKLRSGTVQDSLPPQLAGSIVDGLDMAGWTSGRPSRQSLHSSMIRWPFE